MFSKILVVSISKCKPHIGTFNNHKCCSFNTSQFCPPLNFIYLTDKIILLTKDKLRLIFSTGY